MITTAARQNVHRWIADRGRESYIHAFFYISLDLLGCGQYEVLRKEGHPSPSFGRIQTTPLPANPSYSDFLSNELVGVECGEMLIWASEASV